MTGRQNHDDLVRFEHHITETYKPIVRQPYNRREELVEIAKEVPNMRKLSKRSNALEGSDSSSQKNRENIKL